MDMSMDVQAVMLHKQGSVKKPVIKKWLGNQDCCDMCKASFNDIPWFADARMGRYTGQWAILCPECHGVYTNGAFGRGLGQKYDAKTKVKIEG